jgi:hypothetical protein
MCHGLILKKEKQRNKKAEVVNKTAYVSRREPRSV